MRVQEPPPAPPPPPRPTPTPPPLTIVSPAGPAPQRPDDLPPVPRDVPLTSIVVEEVGPVTPDTGVADVLLGSIALVGALLLASLVVGGLVGAVLVYVKHRLGFGGPDADRDAHVSLAIGRDDEPPPS